MARVGIRLLTIGIATFALGASAMSPIEEAREFRRDVESTPTIELLDRLLPRLGKEISLPIAKIFDQGDTNWCWAFSAYHAMRSYYLNSPAANAGWKAAVGDLNAQDTFRAFLGKHVAQAQTGEPMRFVRMLRADQSLAEDTWTPFMPPDARWPGSESGPVIDMSAVKIVAREQIVAKLTASLEKGSPSAYCSVPHCIMIYGAKLENGRATEYYVADSLGGETYHADAHRMEERLEYVATRQW